MLSRKMKSKQNKSILIGSSLVLINILLMLGFTYTPIPAFFDALFNFFIVGVLVFVGLFFLGSWLSELGVQKNAINISLIGVAILQFTYGAFGSMVLSYFSKSIWLSAIIITAIVTTTITVIAAAYVYKSNKDFRRWGKYSNRIFIAAIVTAVVASFVPALIFITFLMTFLGFLVYLVFEIWKLRVNPNHVLLNAIGIYSATMGVFLHILQIVLRLLSRE